MLSKKELRIILKPLAKAIKRNNLSDVKKICEQPNSQSLNELLHNNVVFFDHVIIHGSIEIISYIKKKYIDALLDKKKHPTPNNLLNQLK